MFGTPGSWTLDFSIINDLSPGFDIYGIYIEIDQNVQVSSPTNWAPAVAPEGEDGWCVLPSQCYSEVPNNGQTISGFVVTSTDNSAPIDLPYVVYAIDLKV